jgi:hypothetical protein
MSAPFLPSPVDRQAERNGARVRIALAAVSFLLVVAVAVAIVVTVGQATTRDPGLPRDAVTPPVSSATPSSSPDVRWIEVAGVALPVSRIHGPRITSRGRAARYAHSELGAAFAAVHVLIRTSATSGPQVFEPVLAQQVTGRDTAAMKLLVTEQYEQLRVQYHVPDGEPIPTGDARVLGFRVTTFDAKAGRAWVDVILSSADLGSANRVVAFDVALRWAGDDWRVIAPSDGDWSSRATLLGSPPAGMVPYGAIRGRGA